MTAPLSIPIVSKPAARKKELDLLAGVDLAGVDEIILRAVLDPHPGVGARACEVLLYRYPWLMLGTGVSRAVADADWEQHRFGEYWRRLRDAVAALVQSVPPGPFPYARRFEKIPGLVPELVEELNSAGRSADAETLIRLASGSRRKPTQHRQILIAPTYACNLACPYCYIKGWQPRMGGPMTREAFGTVVAWCRKQGINWMIFGGGEPTVHPAFPELIEEASRAGIQISLTSNGLFGASVRAAIRAPAVPEFICHVEQDVLRHKPVQTALLRQNLAAASAAGVCVRVRYTLTESSDERERAGILAFAKNCGVGMVNYGFAFRNMDATNESYEFRPDGESIHGPGLRTRNRPAFIQAISALSGDPWHFEAHARGRGAARCMFSQSAGVQHESHR